MLLIIIIMIINIIHDRVDSMYAIFVTFTFWDWSIVISCCWIRMVIITTNQIICISGGLIVASCCWNGIMIIISGGLMVIKP